MGISARCYYYSIMSQYGWKETQYVIESIERLLPGDKKVIKMEPQSEGKEGRDISNPNNIR